MDNLLNILLEMNLTVKDDSWVWNIGKDGSFSVVDTKMWIDQKNFLAPQF